MKIAGLSAASAGMTGQAYGRMNTGCRDFLMAARIGFGLDLNGNITKSLMRGRKRNDPHHPRRHPPFYLAGVYRLYLRENLYDCRSESMKNISETDLTKLLDRLDALEVITDNLIRIIEQSDKAEEYSGLLNNAKHILLNDPFLYVGAKA